MEKLLRLLFLERRRVKDLREKVQEEATPEGAIIEKLKRLATAQRAKLAVLQQREEEIAALKLEIEGLRSSEKLEGDLATTVERLEATDRELHQIKRLYDEMSDERKRDTATKSRLSQTIDQREKEIAELRKKITEEMVHRAQVATERQRERSELEKRLSDQKEKLSTLEDHYKRAGDHESELRNALEKANKEIAELQERLDGALVDEESRKAQIAEFEERLTAAKGELAALKEELAENETLHQQVSDLRLIQSELKERLAEAREAAAHREREAREVAKLGEELANVQSSHNELERQLARAQEAAAQGERETREAMKLTEELEKLQAASRRWQEEQAGLRRQVRERDHQLQTAQRHLAKKLKESALLQQSNEQIKEQLAEQERISRDVKAEMTELSLEKALAEEKVRSAESRARQAEVEIEQWKRDFHNLKSQNNVLKERIGELNAIETKYSQIDAEYQQMRKVFSTIQSSIGNVGRPQLFEATPLNELTPLERPPSPPPIREDREEEAACAVQEDLFG